MIRAARLCLTTMFAVVLAAPVLSATPAEETDQLAGRLLSAVGGRLPWAGLSSTIVYTQQYGHSEPSALEVIITTDYPQRRYRIDAMGSNAHLVRIVDSESDRGWRIDSKGARQSANASQQGSEPSWYIGQAFSTLQRIAVGDPALKIMSSRKGDFEELTVYDGSRRIAWYRLDARNEPAAMGLYDDNVGVICGPWDVERDRIRYPAWLSRPDGSWRVTVKSLAVNIQTDVRLFSQPVVASE